MPTESEIVLSIVLPAYLEEENLRVLLPRLNAARAELGVSSEILVVDTIRPLDQTRMVCSQTGARWIQRQGGNHFGDAIRTGIQNARGERLLFMDADGSHAPEFISELWRQSSDQDVVIASRYIEGGFTENRASLVWMSRILNFTYSVVLGIKVRDVSNSFKLYRTQHLRELNLRCSNFDIVEEILFRLKRRQPTLRVLEIPFTFKKRMFGETKRNLLIFMATYVFTMIRLRFRR